ncbi:hypothetical protein MLD38_022417 [Melastoma candidum]|uniref:Uncharacterized protein n=1 Tax=Melastoma candidum TaxID=119954 RepID=A0ACB9QJ26_9MYRT|nr:hypothetical protein MLD38_022417 [Melastoma candidum]
MGWPKLRILLHLKDRLSLFTSSPARAAVLRATLLSSSPPSEQTLHHLLLLSLHSPVSASSCVSSLLSRLYSSPDAHVSLKCLLALHYLLSRGTFILHGQILSSLAARNCLNLSSFRDCSDPSAWQLSSLVRWYASFLELVLLASKRLSFFYASASRLESWDGQVSEKWISGLGNSELLSETEGLADVLECACKMPSMSGHDLVCEITSKVIEDYGATRCEILKRVHEISDRIDGVLMGDGAIDVDVDGFGRVLERIRDCEANAYVVFGNKRNNDGLWEAVAHTNRKVAEVVERRARKSIVIYAESVRLDASGWCYGQQNQLIGGGGGGGHNSDGLVGRDLIQIPVMAA